MEPRGRAPSPPFAGFPAVAPPYRHFHACVCGTPPWQRKVRRRNPRGRKRKRAKKARGGKTGALKTSLTCCTHPHSPNSHSSRRRNHSRLRISYNINKNHKKENHVGTLSCGVLNCAAVARLVARHTGVRCTHCCAPHENEINNEVPPY